MSKQQQSAIKSVSPAPSSQRSAQKIPEPVKTDAKSKAQQQQSQAPSQKKAETAPQPQISGFDPSKYVKQGLSAENVIRIKECFDIFDYDKSGAITPNELKNAIIALDLNKSAEEILRLVEDLDQDGNKEVSFEEFLQIFGFSGDINDEEVLKDLFNQFDASGEGKISVEDFKRINDLVNERYSETELREMVEYADSDKDGYINWEEFQAVVTKEYPTE